MDWEVRKIEKYYLEKKDPKNLYKNVEDMTPQELREIVFYLIYIITLYSLEQTSSQRKKQKNN